MTQKRHQFTLRLSNGIIDKVEKLANEMGVSKNAVISMILDREVKKVG